MDDKLFMEEEMGFSSGNKKLNDNTKTVTFKAYEIGENYLFPPTTDEYISRYHIARLISLIVDKMDITFIVKTYKGGGTSAYNPKMLLKVWLLGFAYRIYTSRKLEQALEENLPFIWISGSQTPDFRTLNNFRLRLENKIKKIFKQVVMLGIKSGIIEAKDIFVDHSKFEAEANRHKIVWKKQVKNQLAKIDEELDGLFEYIDKLNKEEDRRYGDNGIKENKTKPLDNEKIVVMINKLNKIVNDENKVSKEDKKESKKKLKRMFELYGRKKSYEVKECILGDRNSYSKTDIEATAMMQKDGVSIKPSYNEGIAVENGFVLDYVQSDKSADNVSFKELVDGVIDNIGRKPENIHADGAYGNEENGEYLEGKGINNYLKYNTYRKENSKKWYREKVRKEIFRYDKKNDCYVCPNGVKLVFHEEKEVITATGYKTGAKIYRAEEGKCSNCPYKEYCTTSDRRSIQMSEKYEKHKKVMKNNLDSKKGKELRRRRGFEVESIFGDRKRNRKYHRFVLIGKDKVNIESGLYYTVHNIRKLYNYMIKNWYKLIFEAKMVQISGIMG